MSSEVMLNIRTIEESLPTAFTNVVISSNEETNVVVLRSNVSDAEGTNNWIEKFSKRSRTSHKLQKTKTESYIIIKMQVGYTLPVQTSLIYRRDKFYLAKILFVDNSAVFTSKRYFWRAWKRNTNGYERL